MWRFAPIFIVLFIFGAGCASVPKRNPLPEGLVPKATIPGGENARFWGDKEPEVSKQWFAMSEAETKERYPGIVGQPHHYLAISGGGQNGAFGAGLLCGWTEAGDRPEFTIVTGISTGSLIAPFAYLGPEYDHLLRKFYTQTSTDDILKKRSLLKTVTGDAASSSEPLQALIAQVYSQDVLDAIGAEYLRGRSLTIGTTNLDASRPVHWNIGDIANSGDPGALDLFHKILLASASIPAVFPPVLIEVEADGQVYDELHVDGGASEQVYVYPGGGMNWERVLEKLETPGRPSLYVIRNAILETRYEPVDNKIMAIAGRSVSSMIRTQGIGNMFEIYALAIRDNLEYNLAYIPDEFDVEPQETFDPVYMGQLFDLAEEMARGGYPWKKVPPEYNAGAEEN